MSIFNERTDRVYALVGETVSIEEEIERLQVDDDRHYAAIRVNNEKRDVLLDAQAKIAKTLGPALLRSGPIAYDNRKGDRLCISYTPNAAFIDVVKLAPVHSVELDEPERAFSDAEITEAAAHAAFEDAADDGLDAMFAKSLEMVERREEAAAEDDGEVWHDDDVISLPTPIPFRVDSIGEDGKTARVTMGRQAVIENGVAVIDAEEID